MPIRGLCRFYKNGASYTLAACGGDSNTSRVWLNTGTDAVPDWRPLMSARATQRIRFSEYEGNLYFIEDVDASYTWQVYRWTGFFYKTGTVARGATDADLTGTDTDFVTADVQPGVAANEGCVVYDAEAHVMKYLDNAGWKTVTAD